MSEHNRINEEAHKSPETLEREIDQQRSSIGNIVDALEQRLSPGQLMDQALAYTRGNGGEFARNLGNTLKANPVPTVLTSIGLLWLMMGQNRTVPTSASAHSSGLGEQARHAGAELKDKASQLGGSVSASLSSAGQRLNDGRHQLSDGVRRGSAELRDGFQRMLHEQPLILAAAGVAVGALIGTALPSTRMENQLLGSSSDKLTDKARQLASSGYEKAGEMGRELTDELKHPAGTDRRRDSQPLTGSEHAPRVSAATAARQNGLGSDSGLG